jgi:AcrR family transcriptional regulator
LPKPKKKLSKATPVRLRADAERNRQHLLEAAKVAFSERGPDTSLEEIARQAGVGIGTLYRHFPNRDALLADVYRHALKQLADAAPALAAKEPPLEALRSWMRLFVDYIATKKVIAPALQRMAGGTSELYAGTMDQINKAMDLLISRAVASGDIRMDIEPLDILRAVISVADERPGWQKTAKQLIDIMLQGLKRGPSKD